MSQLIHSGRVDVVDDQMAEVFRSMTPAERLAIAHEMWRSADRTIRFVVRNEHPEWTDDQVQREAVRRLSHGAA
jgi:lauroyl/myristoyl acyltransferase